MTKEEQKQYLKEMKEYFDKLMKDDEAAKAFFVRAGIHTKDGKLAKPYRTQVNQEG
jgi:hypothetical protein